jgi:hypothetical protein
LGITQKAQPAVILIEMIYRKMKAKQIRYRPKRGQILGMLLIGTSFAIAMTGKAQDDKSIFAGAHVGMTIEQCQKYYHRLHIGSMGHSGAPKGEIQVEFRTGDPQRRVYVYYQKSNGKVVSVTYEKMGDGETFSKDEIQYLTDLNQGSGLVTKATGDSFEVSTPEHSQLEQGQ